MDNTCMAKDMEKANKYGKMEVVMKAIGVTIKLTEKAGNFFKQNLFLTKNLG